MKETKRLDQEVIAGWIKTGSSVLDLGCGDGGLLTRLIDERQVRAQGIELDEQATHACISAGLSVFQEDIDTGLSEYGSQSFDYVVLNQTFQQVKKPSYVLKEALRVGKHVIVGFPNFCHITSRLQIFFGGRVPVNASLPYQWYETPNLHFLSIVDFKTYCNRNAISIKKSAYISRGKKVRLLPNVFGEVALFELTQNQNSKL
jgi:methionine biosynthesis protein MetW